MITDAESSLRNVWVKKLKPILLDNSSRDISSESMEALIKTAFP